MTASIINNHGYPPAISQFGKRVQIVDGFCSGMYASGATPEYQINNNLSGGILISPDKYTPFPSREGGLP